MQTKELVPNPKNPRTITDAKLKSLKKAISEFGDLSGIIFNRKTKQLVGGHQRRKLIDDKTPIVILKKNSKPSKVGTVAEGYIEVNGERFSYREVWWPEQKEKAANIAANKGAGEWDMPQLAEWMKDLGNFDLNFDISLTMFDEEELKQFAGITVKEHTRVGATGVDEDEVPEKAPPRSKLGDVYQLGEHRLMCGDSISNDISKLLNGKRPDLIFTDPPYGIDEQTDRAFASPTRKCKGNSFSKIIGDKDTKTAIDSFLIAQNLSDTICFWGANHYSNSLPSSPCWIVWDKRVEENQRDMNSDCELAFVKHPTKKSVRIFRHLWKGMIKASENGQARIHPTQKPITLAEWCFEELSPKGNSVLDLFGGSGSTLIACEKTNRQCFMMELDPHYVDVIIERWEKYTGLKAKQVNPVIKKAVKQPVSSRATNH